MYSSGLRFMHGRIILSHSNLHLTILHQQSKFILKHSTYLMCYQRLRPQRHLGALEVVGGCIKTFHFLGSISIGRVLEPFPKIVINLSRTFDNLRSYTVGSFGTDRNAEILLLTYKECLLNPFLLSRNTYNSYLFSLSKCAKCTECNNRKRRQGSVERG